MSAHRTHYTPRPLRRPWSTGLQVLACAAIGSLVLGLATLIVGTTAAGLVTHADSIQSAPAAVTADQALAQIRLEAFRAGYRAAFEQRCHRMLSSPIGGSL